MACERCNQSERVAVKRAKLRLVGMSMMAYKPAYNLAYPPLADEPSARPTDRVTWDFAGGP